MPNHRPKWFFVLRCQVVQCSGCTIKGELMRPRFYVFFVFLLLLSPSLCLLAGAQDTNQDNTPPQPPAQGGDFAPINPDAKKLPTDVILVKGAVPSATDSSTPVPESGAMNERAYVSQYFGFS